MPQGLNKESILQYLEAWRGLDKSISEEGEAYTVTLKNGNKDVVMTTPYQVGEFFLDFMVDEKPYYSDWYEIMEDRLSEFMAYTRQVTENFLSNDVKVISRGWWVFKTHELQFKCSGTWSNVFEPKT